MKRMVTQRDAHYLWDATTNHTDKASRPTAFPACGSSVYLRVILAQLMRSGSSVLHSG